MKSGETKEDAVVVNDPVKFSDHWKKMKEKQGPAFVTIDWFAVCDDEMLLNALCIFILWSLWLLLWEVMVCSWIASSLEMFVKCLQAFC